MLWRWNYTKYVLVHWTLKFVNYFLSTGDEQCDGYWQCADSSDEFYCTDEGLDTFVCTPPWPEAKKSHLRSKWNFLASGQGVGHDIFGTSFSFQCAHSFTHCWLQLVTFWGILDPVSNCQYATPRGLICLLIVGCNYSQIRCRWINSHWIGCCWVWIHCRWFCCLWTVVFGSIVVGSVVVRPVVVESVARNVLQIILASVFHCLLKYIWCCGSMPL